MRYNGGMKEGALRSVLSAVAVFLLLSPFSRADDRFPFLQGRFGTLGCPGSEAEWDLLGLDWYKNGEGNYWGGGGWEKTTDAQVWFLMRPRMYFTGNNRVWNPEPNPPSWTYRNSVSNFVKDNAEYIGLIAVGNSIIFEDIESGYGDTNEYAQWFHDFAEYVHSQNPDIKVVPGDLQLAWGETRVIGDTRIVGYQNAYRNLYGEEMPIPCLSAHTYATGNTNQPSYSWGERRPCLDVFVTKIRSMRTFMKNAGLQDAAFVATEMGVFNHLAGPPLSDAELRQLMVDTIHYMEGPDGVDTNIGMPSDNYRLVQKWSYSNDGQLVSGGSLTTWGQDYRAACDVYRDSDGDGLTDQDEENVYGTDPDDPDSDDDGMEDGPEVEAGTSPTNRTDVFRITGCGLSTTGGAFVIYWNSVTGRTYSVYGSDTPPGSWSNVHERAGDGGPVSYTNSPSGPDSQIFRLGVHRTP